MTVLPMLMSLPALAGAGLAGYGTYLLSKKRTPITKAEVDETALSMLLGEPEKQVDWEQFENATAFRMRMAERDERARQPGACDHLKYPSPPERMRTEVRGGRVVTVCTLCEEEW